MKRLSAFTKGLKTDFRLMVNSELFTMPGIPSIYYGSEWGFTRVKHSRATTDLYDRNYSALKSAIVPYESDPPSIASLKT